jgi:glycosyltransferase involved in cell wall biosynthesis
MRRPSVQKSPDRNLDPITVKATPLRVLFCVNWAIDHLQEPNRARFSPDYRVPGKPYWFFKHGDYNLDVDTLDCRSFLRIDRLEQPLFRCYPSKATLAWISSRNYDLVVSHGGQMGLVIALLQTLFPRWPSPPHVMFDVGGISAGYGDSDDSTIVRVCRFAAKSLAGVICHNSYLLDFYQRSYPEVAKIAHFIPLGVDTVAFQPQPCEEADEIICVGYAKRDWSLLVRAFARLRTETRLVLLGVPSTDFIIQPGVQCVPRVSIEEMRRRIARARLVVLPLPKVEYSLGQQTFLQSMALGKAVLLPKIPAVVDYIRDGETGFLYEAGNEDDLSRKLEKLLADPETVERVALSGQIATTTHFDEATMADRVAVVLQVAAQRGRFGTQSQIRQAN